MVIWKLRVIKYQNNFTKASGGCSGMLGVAACTCDLASFEEKFGNRVSL